VEANPNMTLLVTSYSGMLVRRYVDQEENVSIAGAPGWGSSPDLLLFAGGPPFDPAIIQSAPDWSFHQPPVAGQANNVYVRGVNVSSGGLRVRVSFSYAVNNPTASPNPLLDPGTWKTDAMTVGGTAQSYVDLTSVAPADRMTNTVPLVWSPAAPPSGGRYVLIAWVDNTGGSAPPPFASLPKFTSLASLSEYFQGQGNVATWDTMLPGLFMRQSLGQTPMQPGTAGNSPDIIVYGPSAAQSANGFTTPMSYNFTTLYQTATSSQRNFIYVRALNPQNGHGSARVYLYYAASTTLAPTGWSTDSFYVAGKPQNWVDLSSDTANEVLVSTVPVAWQATQPPAGSQWMIIACVVVGDDPQPPDFSEIGYGNAATVTKFVATQPQIAWVAVTSNPADPAPSMWFDAPLAPNAAGTQQWVGVQFITMPADGTFSISIPGPDAANTVLGSGLRIPDGNAAIVWPVTYPPNFQTSAIVNYFQGGASPAKGSNIVLAQLEP
jgi:hypothetical protein